MRRDDLKYSDQMDAVLTEHVLYVLSITTPTSSDTNSLT